MCKLFRLGGLKSNISVVADQIKDEISEVRALQHCPFLRSQAVFPGPPTHQELSQGTGKTPGLEEEPKAELDFPFGSPLWAGVEGDDKA